MQNCMSLDDTNSRLSSQGSAQKAMEKFERVMVCVNVRKVKVFHTLVRKANKSLSKVSAFKQIFISGMNGSNNQLLSICSTSSEGHALRKVVSTAKTCWNSFPLKLHSSTENDSALQKILCRTEFQFVDGLRRPEALIDGNFFFKRMPKGSILSRLGSISEKTRIRCRRSTHS